MDTRTGEIISEQSFQQLQAREAKHFIPVVRDLSKREQAQKQINLYSPCACGSGKKFKFCHHRK